jgi:hypothetical protein
MMNNLFDLIKGISIYLFNLIKTIMLFIVFIPLVMFALTFFALLSLFTYYKHKDEI